MLSQIFAHNKLFLLVSFFSLTISAQQAEAFTIYMEDFDDPADQGQGAIGVNSSPSNSEPPVVELGNADWDIDNISSVVGLSQSQQNNDGMANLTAASDFFQVRNNQFEAQDVDGTAIWRSPVIDISSFSDVDFSLDFSELGTLEETGGNGSLDFVDVQYSLDGNIVSIPNQNGFAGDPNFEQHTLLGDFDSQTISQTGLSGNNLQLIVTIQNWAGNELISFDNVLVEEVPWEFSPKLGLFLIGVVFGGNHLRKTIRAKQITGIN